MNYSESSNIKNPRYNKSLEIFSTFDPAEDSTTEDEEDISNSSSITNSSSISEIKEKKIPKNELNRMYFY